MSYPWQHQDDPILIVAWIVLSTFLAIGVLLVLGPHLT